MADTEREETVCIILKTFNPINKKKYKGLNKKYYKPECDVPRKQ